MTLPLLDDKPFRELLGVPARATREEIRRAYRQRAREIHPDFFPADRKAAQELRMIALNEAYAHLLRFPGDDGPEPPAADHPRPPARKAENAGAAPLRPPAKAVGFPKDPAYAYYKQGFLNFSSAVHGIAEMSGSGAPGANPRYFPHFNPAQDFALSLRQLGTARGYFSRVTEDFPQSAWCADAKVKLRRIEGFVRIYRRILENLGAKEQSIPG